LTGWSLADARTHDIPEDRLGGHDARYRREQSLHYLGSQIRRRQGREAALELPDGTAQ
jgi:hypothetical protein